MIKNFTLTTTVPALHLIIILDVFVSLVIIGLHSLGTPALVHHHLRHVPLDDGVVGPEVYQAHAGELERRAAGLHPAQVMHLPELVDDVGVVRDEGVGRPVVAAVPTTVVGVVTAGRYNPVVPAELFEADVEAARRLWF